MGMCRFIFDGGREEPLARHGSLAECVGRHYREGDDWRGIWKRTTMKIRRMRMTIKGVTRVGHGKRTVVVKYGQSLRFDCMSMT